MKKDMPLHKYISTFNALITKLGWDRNCYDLPPWTYHHILFPLLFSYLAYYFLIPLDALLTLP
jgi:hypothetical protein